MTSNQKNWTVFFSTMLAVGSVVLTILEKNGANEATASPTLRLSAWSTLLVLSAAGIRAAAFLRNKKS